MRTIFILILFSQIPGAAAAESPVQVFEAPGSRCRVLRRLAKGETNPTYLVRIKGQYPFAPKSTGINGVHFSGTGKYVALTAQEPKLIDTRIDGPFEYGMVIINCENGKVRAYRKGLPTVVDQWGDDDMLRVSQPSLLKVALPE